MARQQQALPRAEVSVEIALQLLHFLANAFDLDGLLARGRGQAAQFGDVALECINGALLRLSTSPGVGLAGGFGGGWLQNLRGLGGGPQTGGYRLHG